MKVFPDGPGHALIAAEPGDLITLVADGERRFVAEALPQSRTIKFILDRDATALSYVIRDGYRECEIESGPVSYGFKGDTVTLDFNTQEQRTKAVVRYGEPRKPRWSGSQWLVFGLTLYALGTVLVVIGWWLA